MNSGRGSQFEGQGIFGESANPGGLLFKGVDSDIQQNIYNVRPGQKRCLLYETIF